MPYIPDLEFTGAEHRPAAPSVKAAMAPGAGLASLGKDIGEAADDLRAMHEKKEREQSFAAGSRASLALGRELEGAAAFRNASPDPSTWQQDSDGRYARVRELINKEDIPPEEREKLKSWLDSQQGQDAAATTSQADYQRRATNRTDIMRLFEVQMAHGDFDAADATLAGAEQSGNFRRGELDDERADFGYRRKRHLERVEENKLYASYKADPAKHWERFKSHTPPEGADPVKYQRDREFVRGALLERNREDSQDIINGIETGKITSDEDIDHHGADITPAARAELKRSLAAKQNAETLAFRRTPLYQWQVIGETSRLLDEWKPDTANFDVKFNRILSNVASLPPGPDRETLQAQVDQVRTGKLRDVQTRYDAGLRAFDEYDRMLFAKLPGQQRMKTSVAIAGGFLQDTDKLKNWFPEDVVRHISTGTLTGERSDTQSRDRFRQAWVHRQTKTAGDAQLQATAEAIYQDEEEIDYFTKDAIEARQKHDQESGRRRQEFDRWMKLHPHADDTQIRGKISELSNAAVVKSALAQMFTPRPRRT
ncbi:MAG: hypothetical protein EOP88_20935, partial [Verrucomicrobiaceae bacterium]